VRERRKKNEKREMMEEKRRKWVNKNQEKLRNREKDKNQTYPQTDTVLRYE
jgi:hypothetical protein